MVAQINRSVIMGQQDGGQYANTNVDEHGHLEVAVHSPLTAFRDLRTSELTPVFQERFSYGVQSDVWRTVISGSGGVTGVSGSVEVSSGAGANDFSALQSRRRIVYRPGLGGLLRFTAAFPGSGSVNHQRIAGIGSTESGWFIGENPADGAFGFLHRYGGLRPIRTLTISTPAAGAETATVTLNGSNKAVSVTAGTTAFNASQIAAADYSTVDGGWDTDQVGSTVVFIGRPSAALTGSYGLSAGGGAISGSFATTRSGKSATDDWTPQASFSGDVLDGNGGASNPSNFALDKTKGNVYALNWQYLGYGPQFLYVETASGANNPTYTLAHSNTYINENDYPSLANPCAPILVESRSTGATSNKTIRNGSFGAFVEGRVTAKRSQPVISNVTSALSTTEIPLFTIRMPYTYNAYTNQTIAELHKINVSFKPQTANYYATFRIRRGATLTAGTSYARPYANGAMLVDTTATGVSGGTIEWQATLTDSEILSFDWQDQNLLLEPGETLTFTAVANNGSTNLASMSVTYGELQ